MSVFDRIATADKLYVQQKFTLVVNKYRISTVADDGANEGDPLLYVQQKRLTLREQINLFTDEEQTELALRLQKRNVMEFHGRTEVQLADGTIIGQLQKVFRRSLFRSTWEIRDASGEHIIATAQESNMFIAILRRVWDEIPIVGNVPFFIPFHFDIAINGRTVGMYRRITGFQIRNIVDRYILDLSGDTDRQIDRRVAAAFAIALDALQDR